MGRGKLARSISASGIRLGIKPGRGKLMAQCPACWVGGAESRELIGGESVGADAVLPQAEITMTKSRLRRSFILFVKPLAWGLGWLVGIRHIL